MTPPFKTYAAPVPPGTIKLAISMVCNRTIEPRCEMAFGYIMHMLTAFGVPFGMFHRLQASLLPSARQECLNEVIGDGCTHQFWLDDDIEAQGDVVLRMLDDMKKCPEADIIAANYVRKQQDLRYTAETPDGKMMESYGKTGLEEAARIGLGCALVKLDKVRKTKPPHFEVRWNEEFKSYRGEDRYFTEKLRNEVGARIFVDHDISNNCQHWGSIPYSPRLWHPEDKRDSSMPGMRVGYSDEILSEKVMQG
jgi:hypothetical protein